MTKQDSREFTLDEAIAIAKRNDPGDEIPSVSRVLLAEINRLQSQQAEGGEAVAWRVRIADGTSFLTVNRDIVDKWEGATWEPLYTRPAPAQQAVTIDNEMLMRASWARNRYLEANQSCDAMGAMRAALTAALAHPQAAGSAPVGVEELRIAGWQVSCDVACVRRLFTIKHEAELYAETFSHARIETLWVGHEPTYIGAALEKERAE